MRKLESEVARLKAELNSPASAAPLPEGMDDLRRQCLELRAQLGKQDELLEAAWNDNTRLREMNSNLRRTNLGLKRRLEQLDLVDFREQASQLS